MDKNLTATLPIQLPLSGWDARPVSNRPRLPPVVEASEVGHIPGVVVCDVRWYLDGRSGRDAYDGGHLPGAVFVDLDEHLTATSGPAVGRHPLPTPEAFARSMGVLGIGPDDPVVAYDDAGGMVAGRLVWMLRTLERPAALLDGGIGCWNGSLETAPTVRSPVVVSGEVPAEPWPVSALATIDEVGGVAATDGVDGIVLDARGGDRYRGETEPVDPRAGHVPGARNAPFAGNLESDGPRAGRFLEPCALADRYRNLGVVDAADVVAYCGSGVSACHDLLAMEHAGLGRGRLFVGSWSQWSHTNRPAAVGPEPG